MISPDGRRLAFSTLEFTRVEERTVTDRRVRVVDLDTGAEHAVPFEGPAIDAILARRASPPHRSRCTRALDDDMARQAAEPRQAPAEGEPRAEHQ